MGPEEKTRHVCYIMQGGKPVAHFESIADTGELEITLTDEGAGPLIMGAVGPLAFEMKVSLPKEWRCASRKRFVKLLMSYGGSRNAAMKIAAIVPAMKGQRSYQQLFFQTLALYADYCLSGKEK